MASPFPGMNPYLESQWSNVHVLMMGAITAALKRSLPAGLQARPEEEVRIETFAGERLHGFRPDVAIVESTSRPPTHRVSAGGTVALAEPVEIRLFHGPLAIRHVEIVDTRNDDRVVTVIEVLSPWNKLPGKLNEAYTRKLEAFEAGGANWIEIDLLRSSRDQMSIAWTDLPADQQSDYLVTVCDVHAGRVLGYPISLRSALPTIRVPLRTADESSSLSLQDVLQRVYDDGPFDSIDYAQPCDPPLTESDTAWLRERLKLLASDAS